MKRIFSILLLFGLLFCFVTPIFANSNLETEYPSVDNLWDNRDKYPNIVIISDDGVIKFIMGKVLYYNTNTNTLSVNVPCKVYNLVDNEWVLNYESDTGYTQGFDNSTVIVTNTNIYDTSGDLYMRVSPSYYCDGTSCPATDVNVDNICDDCGLPLTLSLRNDTYSFNGYPMPRIIEVESGSQYDLFDYWGKIYGPYNLVIVSRTGNFDSSLMYQVAPNVEIVNGNVVTADDTEVILFKPAYSDGGTPYWKYTATDTWSSGSLLAPKDQILWSGDSISADSSTDIIEGDPNFMDPLWVTVEKVTQGEIPKMTESLVGSVTLLTACGIGLLTLLVALVMLRKKSVIFLR